MRCPSVTPAEGGALAFLESVLKRAGFEVHRVTFAEPGTDPIENLYARIGTSAPHLMFAGHTDVVPPGEVAAWSHPPFAGEDRQGHALRPRRRRHEGRDRLPIAATLDPSRRQGGKPRRRARSRSSSPATRKASRSTARVKLLKWAAERGEKFDHCILGEPTNRGARRHDQDRPARLAERHADRDRHAGPRRPIRNSPTIRSAAWCALSAALCTPSRSMPAPRISTPRISNSPRSMSATRPSTSFPARRARASTSASTICHDRIRSLKTLIEKRAAQSRGGNSVRWSIDWEPSNADVFLTAARPVLRLSSRTPSPK